MVQYRYGRSLGSFYSSARGFFDLRLSLVKLENFTTVNFAVLIPANDLIQKQSILREEIRTLLIFFNFEADQITIIIDSNLRIIACDWWGSLHRRV